MTPADTITALRLLRSGRWRAEELAAQMGHDKRSTLRLLAALRGAGVELEQEREWRDIYYRVTRAALERAFEP